MARIGLCAATLAALAGACAPQGDFGRPAASAFVAAWPAEGFPFRLTDDEKQLRRQAYGLVLPARDSQDVERAIAELRFVGIWPRDFLPADARNYHAALLHEPFRSSEGRVNALIDDVMRDEARLELFRPTGRAVYLADLERLARAPFFDPVSRAEAEARVEENRRLVAWVCVSLLDRLAGYRYAVARLWIETPSERLRVAEAAVAKLAARIGEPAVVAWSEPVPLAAGPVFEIVPRPVALVSK